MIITTDVLESSGMLQDFSTNSLEMTGDIQNFTRFLSKTCAKFHTSLL